MTFKNLIPFRGVLNAFLSNQYLTMFNFAAPKKEATFKIEAAYKKLLENKALYQQIVSDIGNPKGITWYLIGCIHMRECSFRLDQHLANGDRLTGKTTRVPAGLPIYPLKAGQKAYSFREAAVAVLLLKTKGFTSHNKNLTSSPIWSKHLQDDSIASLLAKLESFNGFGYLNNNRVSPYLWSDSTIEVVGKYTSDGKFDPKAKDKQLGAGTLLKYYLEQEKKKQPSNLWGNLASIIIGGGYSNFK